MAKRGTGGAVRGKPDSSWSWILVPASIIGIILIAAIFVSRRPASNAPPAAVATTTVAEASPPPVPTTAEPTGTTSPVGLAPPLAGTSTAGGTGRIVPEGFTPDSTQTLPPPGLPINTSPSTGQAPVMQPALKPPLQSPRPVPPAQNAPPATASIPPATSTRARPSETSTSTNTSTSTEEDRRTINEAQARSRLWPVVDANYDNVESDCLKIESLGYTDGGYNFLVTDSCANNTLGRWRVDAKTREVSQQ